MRYVTVRRAAIVLGGVFLVCAGLFAWVVSRGSPAAPVAQPAAAPAGAVLFGTYCASCHTAEDLRPSVTGPGANREELEAFLADHGDASAEQDRVILEYLSQPGGGANGAGGARGVLNTEERSDGGERRAPGYSRRSAAARPPTCGRRQEE